HEGTVYSLAVTGDGKRILSAGSNQRIRVWDVETHELIEEWASHTGHIDCIALSPDDRLVASGHVEGKFVIMEMKESGKIKHSINAGGWVCSLCFSPNSEKLACAGSTNRAFTIQVYDVDSGKLVLGPIKGHGDAVNCVLWSLDGSQIFSASNDRTIRCWNSESGESIGEPWTGHTKAVVSLSLSPDGTILASASHDKTVRFWDARPGHPIGQPLQHEDVLWVVTFSPSGAFVASGGYHQKVSIW
ncbi:hypothetical protein PAXINDRAFT_29403, partial [Paxillus involutus ATCC 200175]